MASRGGGGGGGGGGGMTATPNSHLASISEVDIQLKTWLKDNYGDIPIKELAPGIPTSMHATYVCECISYNYVIPCQRTIVSVA